MTSTFKPKWYKLNLGPTVTTDALRSSLDTDLPVYEWPVPHVTVGRWSRRSQLPSGEWQIKIDTQYSALCLQLGPALLCTQSCGIKQRRYPSHSLGGCTVCPHRTAVGHQDIVSSRSRIAISVRVCRLDYVCLLISRTRCQFLYILLRPGRVRSAVLW